MHPTLSIPWVVGSIFQHCVKDDEADEITNKVLFSVRARYQLAGVCRVWRGVVHSRFFNKLYIRLEENPKYNSRTRTDSSSTPDSNAEVLEAVTVSPDRRFRYTTNIVFHPLSTQLRHVVLHICGDDIFTQSTADYLTRRVFANRGFPSARTLTIIALNLDMYGMGRRNYSPLEDTIRDILQRVPSISGFRLIPKGRRMAKISIQRALVTHFHAITSLRLGAAPFFEDLSGLELPALTNLFIDYNTGYRADSIPIFNASRLKSLHLYSVDLATFMARLEWHAAENMARFSQLEVLDLRVRVPLGFEYPDDDWRATHCSFPKLRYLSLRSWSNHMPDLYWLFADAPLERLKLAGNIHTISQFEIAQYPAMTSFDIQIDDRLHSQPNPEHIVANIIQPTSLLQRLTITSIGSDLQTPYEFGCKLLRYLKIRDAVPFWALRHILSQLPVLIKLDIRCPLTRTGNGIKLTDVQTAVQCSPSTVLSHSLEQLVIHNSSLASQRKTYSDNFALLTCTLARTPSLVRLLILGVVRVMDGSLIQDVFQDRKIMSIAKHFAGVKVRARSDI
ncbi:hypothetical protein DL89DRAFT_257798 [Linderina pennispora]|uniref:F-box domain-containing protein n=1 Tax=Linderina pennispora TaxID=61395 RepID=A0A1Y1W8I7_9FUNG|nr:uncharacterized protein DL89DRAFT_257798 [Linderina pennispora]ORX69556.1 hypothetical protein DL89DRAFT_257798 [Linderina pennispora]